MTDVNEALLRKVADLARLELSDNEIQKYAGEIGEILKHIDQLSTVNVDGVEPMYHGVDGHLRLREDRIVEFPKDENGNPKVLASAPETLDGGYKVPPIL